jgi:hypothetical protein
MWINLKSILYGTESRSLVNKEWPWSTRHSHEYDQFSLINHSIFVFFFWRFQWPRGLRRGSAAARLLALWVRILQGTWMLVSVVCCQVEVTTTSRPLVQRSPTECGASLFVIWKPPEWGDNVPRWAVARQEKKVFVSLHESNTQYRGNPIKMITICTLPLEK